jgi:hypothetical protein
MIYERYMRDISVIINEIKEIIKKYNMNEQLNTYISRLNEIETKIKYNSNDGFNILFEMLCLSSNDYLIEYKIENNNMFCDIKDIINYKNI